MFISSLNVVRYIGERERERERNTMSKCFYDSFLMAAWNKEFTFVLQVS